jgi:hypothetical protein
MTRRQKAIRRYLEGIAFATLETSRDLRLLPTLLRLLRLIPMTIAELAKSPCG